MRDPQRPGVPPMSKHLVVDDRKSLSTGMDTSGI